MMFYDCSTIVHRDMDQVLARLQNKDGIKGIEMSVFVYMLTVKARHTVTYHDLVCLEIVLSTEC